MPADLGPDSLVSGDGRLVFAFAHELRGHLRTVVTRTQLVTQGSPDALSSEDRFMLDEVARGERDR